jgi:hypothetical protein
MHAEMQSEPQTPIWRLLVRMRSARCVHVPIAGFGALSACHKVFLVMNHRLSAIQMITMAVETQIRRTRHSQASLGGILTQAPTGEICRHTSFRGSLSNG